MVMRVWLATAALLLAACENQASLEAEMTATPGWAPGPAREMAEAASPQLPDRHYRCRIWHPAYSGPALESREEDQPYGTLNIVGDRYLLVLEGGSRTEGRYRLASDRTIEWQGDLGQIDDAPRRVVGSRLTAYDDTLNLVFDFDPPTQGSVPRSQLICRASASTD